MPGDGRHRGKAVGHAGAEIDGPVAAEGWHERSGGRVEREEATIRRAGEDRRAVRPIAAPVRHASSGRARCPQIVLPDLAARGWIQRHDRTIAGGRVHPPAHDDWNRLAPG